MKLSKTPLIVTAVLMALAGTQAHGLENGPAYAPIQITAPNGGFVASLQVAPKVPTDVKTVATPQATPQATSQTTPSKAAPTNGKASDSESVAELKRAEANFRPMTSSKQKQVLKPETRVASAPAVPKAKPKKVAVAAPARPTPVVMNDRSSNAQLPSIRRNGAIAVPNAKMDAAAMATSNCASLGQHALKCMRAQLDRAELLVESAETKAMNCAQLRKFEPSYDKAMIDKVVAGQMYTLRAKATDLFDREVQAAGQVSRLKTREIGLRSTLAHLKATRALANRVCSTPEFSELYAQMTSGQAQ